MAAAAADGVVVVGGGVIGACIAFYLADLGVHCTVVEREAVACAASGRSGGFLARSWCDSTPALGALARSSFDLHASLAETMGGERRWGYRRVQTLAVSVTETRGDAHAGKGSSCNGPRASGKRAPPPNARAALPPWLDAPGCIVGEVREIAALGESAQVTPADFTRAMLDEAAKRAGSEVVIGTVVQVAISEGGMTCGVQLEDGRTFAASQVVVACGPWSQALLPVPVGLARCMAHSVVCRPARPADEAVCLFLDWRSATGAHYDPEVYPRPDGTVYVCGMACEDADLAPTPASVRPNGSDVARLWRVCASVSGALAGPDGVKEVVAEQACFLPYSRDSMPVAGAVPGVPGLFVATGHGCWGILNAPATGLGLAELMTGCEKPTVPLTAFDPSRFANVSA